MTTKVLGLIGALALVIVAAFASPANAAPMCGDSCNHEDPQTYWAFVDAGGVRAICGHDAITASTFTGLGRTVQLRYSPTCRTVWARIFGGRSQDKIVLETRQYDGHWTYRADWEMFDPANHNWSIMMNDAGLTTRACFQLTWATTPGSRVGCTGGY